MLSKVLLNEWIQYLFIYLAAVHSMQDLSSLTGMEPTHAAVEVRSRNHWTARELPGYNFLINSFMIYNSHTIKFTTLECTIQWVLVYSQSCATIPII